MSVFQIIIAIVSAVESLESAGHITIGGWDPNAVTAALEGIKTVLKSVQTSGLGGQSTPPGTDKPVGS